LIRRILCSPLVDRSIPIEREIPFSNVRGGGGVVVVVVWWWWCGGGGGVVVVMR
jgi:hypothetical protein